MVRLNKSFELAPQVHAPTASVLREAHRLADSSAPTRAREVVGQFLDATCRSVLGDAEREKVLDHFFEDRKRSKLAFLEGSGLVPDPEIKGCYRPGSWRLSIEPAGHGWRYVIDGVRAADGGAVLVRLTPRQFIHAGATLRAIKKVVDFENQVAVTTREWHRVWHGFDYTDGSRMKQLARGLRLSLRDQLTGEGQ